MGLRELLILLLGLAIVAVILRGLYVAIQARRGQIRLAIDKNIPQDVDLEALELAELPGGGARVVRRDGGDSEDDIPADPITRANARAESMELGRDDQSVPVLMDTVQVGSANRIGEQDAEADQVGFDQPAESFEEAGQETTQEAWSDDVEAEESWEDEDSWRAEPHISAIDEPALSEDSVEEIEDEVEYDYEDEDRQTTPAIDSLSSVQPDYPDDEGEFYQDELAQEEDEELDDESYGDSLEAVAEVDDYADDYEDEEPSDDHQSAVVDYDPDSEQEREEPRFDPVSNDDMDSFSMTAGERIGGNPQRVDADQGSLFAADDDKPAAPPSKRKSLFSALRGRIASLRDSEDVQEDEEEFEDVLMNETVVAPVQDAEPELPDSIPTEQLDIESSFETEFEQEPVPVQRPEPVATELRAPSSPQRSEVKQQDAGAQSSEVLVLNVMAREGREFRGEDLLHAVITSGLKFGDMQIFHHRWGNGSTGPVIFSLANVLNPGTFDLNSMGQFSTIGVSLFMAMPTPINNLDAFEQMLAVAQQLCATLDGELKDDHRNVMTAQTIEHYRQRIRDFALRQLKTAGGRG